MKLRYFAIFLMAFLMVGAVSAADIDDYAAEDFDNLSVFDKDTVVDVGGINFTIPKDFGHLEGFDMNETDDGINSYMEFFANRDGDVIMISEVSGDDVSLDLDTYTAIYPDSDKKTIDGFEGLEFEKEGYDYFVYINGDKVILLQSPEDDYFSVIVN